MIIKTFNKRILIFASFISVLLGVFVVMVRYDWALNDSLYNNFLFLHDDDTTSMGFHTFITVMNVILLFPFAMELLTDHKSTNEIYIVSRMSNSVKFYYFKFFQLIILSLAESIFYNSALLITYCSLGNISEDSGQLKQIIVYSILINFLVALTFMAVMQISQTLANEKTALILVILLFCLCVLLGFKMPNNSANFWITNYYFITPVFSTNNLYSVSFAAALTLPAAITFLITIIGSIIYKHKDHI